MDQHANAFSETLPPTVVQDTEQNILVGIVTKSLKRPGTRPGMATAKGTTPVSDAGRLLKTTESRKQKHPVLKGKALKDWIADKGFDGVTTKAQRERPREKGKGPEKEEGKRPHTVIV